MRAALLFVLLASTPAYAFVDKTSLESNESTAGNSTPAEKEKQICKRMAASESRMSAKRVCLTAAEWKKADADADR